MRLQDQTVIVTGGAAGISGAMPHSLITAPEKHEPGMVLQARSEDDRPLVSATEGV